MRPVSSIRLAAVAALACLGPARALAAPTTCSVATATDVAFGDYDPFSVQPVLATGSVRYRCPKPILPRIDLDGGQAASFAPRWMRSARDVLAYNLYLDAACTTIWGDGSQGTREYQGTAATETVTMYGRVPAGQDVSAGTYTDVVTVTFNF